ncbi:MAG: Crp/Fnr family transcriptional regulator [Betaproteobacteria bacterium]|nr:Crp/Fnr family transcriptional regulator [Betaproteobacteria bacterium]
MDAKRQQQISTLAKAAMFIQLPDATLERLAAGMTESLFRRGNVVFGRGAAATGMYIVASGQLKLTQETREGAEHVVELLQEGDSFGEAALLTQRLHLVTATAVSECKVLHIRRQTLLNELENDQAFARTAISMLSDRLYRQTAEMESVLLLTAAARVARFIFHRLNLNVAKASRRVALPFRKCLIASHLNMTPEHFSRTLRDLTMIGLISVKGGLVDIIEVDRLRDAAGLMIAPVNSRLAA